jgi:hypothetical protein
VRGVVGWGLTVAVIWSFARCFIMGWHSDLVLPGIIVAFAIGGYFWGMWTWYITERQYAKAIAEQVE